jgi:ribosomal protein L32E
MTGRRTQSDVIRLRLIGRRWRKPQGVQQVLRREVSG